MYTVPLGAGSLFSDMKHYSNAASSPIAAAPVPTAARFAPLTSALGRGEPHGTGTAASAPAGLTANSSDVAYTTAVSPSLPPFPPPAARTGGIRKVMQPDAVPLARGRGERAVVLGTEHVGRD